MNTISDTAILAALGRQMTIAVARQGVAASNLANIDTPGYRTREATFDDALDQELGGTLQPVRTSAAHQGGGDTPSAPTRETAGLQSRRDGNNVQIDRELLAMNRSAGDFGAAQTALAAKFRLVRYAINEGR